MIASMTCPLCGHSFNPAEEPGCTACPLHSGCNLVCCPACGYKTVDARQSWLARMASSLMAGASFSKEDHPPPDRNGHFPRFFRRRGRRHRGGRFFHGRGGFGPHSPFTLLEVPVGNQVKIKGFAPDLSPARKSQLQAYGLVPGYWVDVLQHSPVTVVKIEQSEMALENDLARMVWVSEIGPDQAEGEDPSDIKIG